MGGGRLGWDTEWDCCWALDLFPDETVRRRLFLANAEHLREPRCEGLEGVYGYCAATPLGDVREAVLEGKRFCSDATTRSSRYI